MVISLRPGSIDTSAALLAEMVHETCRHLFNWVLPASGVVVICFSSPSKQTDAANTAF